MPVLLLTGCALLDPPAADEAFGAGERAVWVFRERDGRYVRDAEALAHGFSSLGAGVVDDTLIVTGLCWWEGCGSMWRRKALGPPIHALTTHDGVHWDAAMFRLSGDPTDRVPIDPSIAVTADGPELWYYAVDAQLRGDPAHLQADHVLSRAGFEGHFASWREDAVAAPMLADPSPVEFEGERLLVATSRPGQEIALWRGDAEEPERRWSGVSVPHLSRTDTGLELWAQTIVDGHTVAVRATSADGRQWSGWDRPLEGLRDCASPVAATVAGQRLALCVDEPLQGPR